jgi:hypothetical protein
MAENIGDKRRIFLFETFGKYIKVKYGNEFRSYYDLNLGEKAPSGAGYAAFIQKYFKDEQGLLKFFEDIKKVYNSFKNQKDKKEVQSWVGKVDLNGTDPKNLFVFYACDLSWAASTSYCGGSNASTGGTVNINDYIGTYIDNVTKGTLDIADKDGTSLKLVAYGQSINLINKAADSFNVEIDLKYAVIKGVLDFKREPTTNNVTGFHYKFENVPPALKSFLPANFQPEGDATKDATSSSTSDFFKDKDNNGTWDYFMGKSSSPYPREKTNTGAQQNTPPKQNVLKNEPYKVPMPDNIIPCDENAYNWVVGCQNNKIKELNLRLLGREDNGVYTKDLKLALSSLGYLSGFNTEITKSIYDTIITKTLQESVVKKVVLKNLKQLLNRNI